ncbi:M14 family zinc carboxypeptidase [Aeoliella mucimassa]|uniref:Zinc carboxypeptidase n=1 Tax=Aeoliella mucimassa TaxID=2527972 RepID=A0A518AS83_9BACT|nr:M14 family zinc carboxypeptidase [Aeoliella mucimassa]QDU57583.1 Zinc carboxypeptidase [Aeoliella mucimassa]
MREFPFEDLSPTDRHLLDLHHRFRISPANPGELRQKDVATWLKGFEQTSASNREKHPVQLRTVGKSHNGQEVYLATIGTGPNKVFMWSQMHGDEPTHTAVLLDLLNTLVSGQEEVNGELKLLETCTLHLMPMLNPDGADLNTRENAQGIDINRDAVDLATPEGRILRQVTLDLKPNFGFNLHNQRANKVVTGTEQVAAISVLAPPINDDDTVTPSVKLARQLALEMFAVGTRLLKGHATRYEAGYMPTAFGEWVQNQGASTALLEAGGWPDIDSQANDLVELHYVALMTALISISQNRLQEIDASRYKELPLNQVPEE